MFCILSSNHDHLVRTALATQPKIKSFTTFFTQCLDELQTYRAIGCYDRFDPPFLKGREETGPSSVQFLLQKTPSTFFLWLFQHTLGEPAGLESSVTLTGCGRCIFNRGHRVYSVCLFVANIVLLRCSCPLLARIRNQIWKTKYCRNKYDKLIDRC